MDTKECCSNGIMLVVVVAGVDVDVVVVGNLEDCPSLPVPLLDDGDNNDDDDDNGEWNILASAEEYAENAARIARISPNNHVLDAKPTVANVTPPKKIITEIVDGDISACDGGIML